TGGGDIGVTGGQRVRTTATTLSADATTTGDVNIADTINSSTGNLTGTNQADNYDLLMTGNDGALSGSAGQTVSGNSSVSLTTTGTGAVTVNNLGSVTAPSITITANDLDLKATGQLDATGGTVTLTTNGNQTMGLAGGAGTFNVSATEFTRILA